MSSVQICVPADVDGLLQVLRFDSLASALAWMDLHPEAEMPSWRLLRLEAA